LSRIRIRPLQRISDATAVAWNHCAGDDNPFVRHEFLLALEESGCVAPRHGWQPTHLIAEDAAGKMHGALPLYFKGHSQGEYIFDQGWADAYERAGGRYYPKLLSAVPFSPVTGPRFLIPRDADTDAIRSALLEGAIDLAAQHNLSSLHINFIAAEDLEFCRSRPELMHRMGEQFHWQNAGYTDFEDFLEALASRKRKTIRKERREAVAAGVTIHALAGTELNNSHWDAFYGFYLDTGSRKWGRPYLNRDFFRRLHAAMADRVVLVMAEREGNWIAGAWNMLGRDTLYGRNWGCIEHHPFLHFECCYYQAIEFAIRHRLSRVEAGAQGEHKLARGYLPQPVHSMHWIANPPFARAVGRFLDEERNHMAGLIAALDQHSPFRQTQDIPESE